MKKRVFSAKLLSGVSVSVLFLAIGTAQAAEQNTTATGQPAAGSHAPAASGQVGNTGSGRAQGNSQGSSRGNFGFGGNYAGRGAGQGYGQGAGRGAGQGQGYYNQGYGPYGQNPYRRPNNGYGQFRAPVAAPRAPQQPVAKAPAAKAPSVAKSQPQQQQGRRWMPSWLKLPGRGGPHAATDKAQGSAAKTPPAAPIAAPAQPRQVQRPNAPQGWVQPHAGQRYGMPPRGWNMPRQQVRPPWMRGPAQQPPRGPGFNANRPPDMGGQMPNRPMPRNWTRPQMPNWMKNRTMPSMPDWAKKRPTMPAWVKKPQMPEWAKKRPTMPEWAKHPKMPDWAKKRPTMPAWAKKPQMPEWAKKRPTMPEWAKHPKMPQMPEWAKKRPAMPEWAKKPQMPDWVKKKLGLSAGKKAGADKAAKPAVKTPPAAGGTPAAHGGQPPTRKMVPAPWMNNAGPAGGAGNMPGAAARPNWAPSTPPWMRRNPGQGAATSAGKAPGKVTAPAAVPGKQSNATKTAPWWGGVVTSGGK